jgi:hypothetical protein
MKASKLREDINNRMNKEWSESNDHACVLGVAEKIIEELLKIIEGKGE